TQQYYLPLSKRGAILAANGSQRAREIASWKTWVRQQWPHTSLNATAHLPATAKPGQKIEVQASVNPAGIRPEELRVEAVLKRGNHVTRVPLAPQGDGRYSAQVPLEDSGLYSVGVRM
ncbi:hypothetical protein QO169_29930, partial [Pseudomonas aeruginosa]|nr:hypothetical protein [Pseudomonas aeruginosa]